MKNFIENNEKLTSVKKKEKVFFNCVLSLTALFLFFICYTAEGTFDSGDGLSHYFISRYSWKHPYLLLDHWGKPFFTLLSSPFSQFGLLGMNVFQISCGIATSYFCYRIATKIKLKFTWLIPVLLFFSPVYFAVINSGLTEILFGCLLTFSIWMLFENRFITASVFASFLPFVRVDAFVTIPLIVVLLILKKQVRALLFLLTGFIIYSIAGYFYYHDILWVLHQSQSFFDEGYPGMKGGYFHYLKHYQEILGSVTSILLLIGIGWAVYISVISLFGKSKTYFLKEEILLIFGSFLACLVIHTLSYCLPGVLNNLGMIRYMATLVPVASLIALHGLNILVEPLKKLPVFQLILVASISIFIIISPFNQWYYPYKPDGEQLVLQKASDWLKKKNLTYPRICYLSSSLPLFYNVDPFDQRIVIRYLNIDEPIPSDNFPEGSILVWDAHYSANEGRISLNNIMEKKNLKLLKIFQPEIPFKVIGNSFYDIRVFKAVSDSNSQISDSDILKEWNFEEHVLSADSGYITDQYAASGKYSFKLTYEHLYSPTYKIKVGELRKKGIDNISATVEIFPVFNVENNTSLIASLENDSIYYYHSLKLESINPLVNKWNTLSANIVIPERARDNDWMKIYIYQSGGKYIYIDNFIIKGF